MVNHKNTLNAIELMAELPDIWQDTSVLNKVLTYIQEDRVIPKYMITEINENMLSLWRVHPDPEIKQLIEEKTITPVSNKPHPHVQEAPEAALQRSRALLSKHKGDL